MIVRINDRGPFHDNRLIDLSYAAAVKIGVARPARACVEVRALTPGEVSPKRAAAVAAHAAASAAPDQRQSMQAISRRRRRRRRAIRANATAQPRIYLQVGASASVADAERAAQRVAAASSAKCA